MVRKRGERHRLFLTLALAALCAAALAGPAGAVTTLEGYSSFMTEFRSSGGGDPSWGLSNPQLYAEFRLKSSPWRDIDSFLKISAESNRWIGYQEGDVDTKLKETKFYFREAHVRFKANRFETHLFTGQDRFWLNEPLLQIVDSGQVKHDDYGPRAQGIRMDFWDTYGFSGAAFVSERSDYIGVDWESLSDAEQDLHPGSVPGDTLGSSTDDYRGFRVNRKLWDEKISLGTTYARKDMNFDDSSYIADSDMFQQVMAVDAEVALGDVVPLLSEYGRVTWVTEYGRNTSGELKSVDDKQVNGFKTEIRDVRVGPMRFLGAWEDYGKDFYADELAHGDRQNLNDYSQYYVEAHYRVPRKAVNLKGWLRHAEPGDPMSTSHAQSVGTMDEWGTEAYIEFLNGFTGKTEYKVYEDNNGTWPNLFFELTGENRLVKLRTQFRIKDIETDYELRVYGFEANVNLSDVWKFYARVMNVDEETESRQTAFAQVRYLGWNSAEFFVEFGNPDHSNDLANDGDFVSHGDNKVTEQVFKAFVRIYY